MTMTNLDGTPADEHLITDMRCALPTSAWTDADCTIHHRPISQPPEGKWRIIDYRSTLYNGSCLHTARPDAAPIRIPLNRKGWHAVSIGMAHPWCHITFAEVRLSGDKNWQLIRSSAARTSEEPTSGSLLHEEPWIFADLTGRDLEVRYPPQYAKTKEYAFCSIYSVRAVPVREADLPLVQSRRHRRMVAFMEPSFDVTDRRFLNEQWDVFCANNTESDLVYYRSDKHELVGDGAWDLYPYSWVRHVCGRVRELLDRGEDPLQSAIDEIHANGKRFWMGLRPQAWAAVPPLDQAIRSPFFRDHPEYRCLEANGEPISKLSIAFKPVRDRLSGTLKEALDRGADGVAVIFIRGFPLVRYEQPVLDRFREKYGQDAREAPDSDERLLSVWAEFVTNWMDELRQMLDEAGPSPVVRRRELAAIVGPSLEWNRQFGFDIAAWAQKGLVDVVMPYPCGSHHTARLYSELYEKPDGWIDVAGFKRVLVETPVELIPSLGHYADHFTPIAIVRQRANDFYRAGATGLCRWDDDPPLAQIGLDDPETLNLWCSHYMPPQDNLITELEGLNLTRFAPGIGF